ncbi:MAG: HAMP domain-containing histidine kinase [Planctomycetes bacterium]|nr:HAMP domain-containing histidine kinase [Planctomycetota bacterium]
MKRYVRPSLKKPVSIFVAILALTIGLSVLWNVVLSADYERIRALAQAESSEAGSAHWFYLFLGTALFLTIILLVIWFAVGLFAAVKLNQRLSLFLATVSHELNSPLSAIKLYAQTLRHPELAAAERGRFVETILANVDRLSRQIQNILRAAQEDQDQLEPALAEVDLGSFLEAFVAETRVLVERRAPGGTLALEDGRNVRARLDSGLFRQVLDNLVDNAVKYAGKEPPAIVIRAGQDPDGISFVEVADNGRGIPPDRMPWLFERFERIEDEDPSRRREGIGLGLSIVRSIVLLHGGTVDARSPGLDLGTTIRITLPALRETEALA